MPKAPDPNVVVLLSGGLDSAVAAHALQRGGSVVTALAVDYGQRHRRELRHAKDMADDLGVHLHVARLQLPFTCAMTTPGAPLPQGVGTFMDNTYVPGLGALLVSLAAAYAAKHFCMNVVLGCSAETAEGYRDARQDWVDAMDRAMHLGYGVGVLAPLLHRDKGGIVVTAREWGMPVEATYSCLQGGRVPCGRCVKCVQRQRAGA